ncbi:YhbD family protein [Paenibacillus sp. strain BS8-2]
MEKELISKKELLETTGISYGQLYRWKRKGLIPEDWFIRKSAFTGQETFFPKDLILARIDKILHLKDDLSLDELADQLASGPINVSLNCVEMIERNIVSTIVAQRYMDEDAAAVLYSFDKMLNLFALELMLRTGEMGLDEGGALRMVLEEHYSRFKGDPCDLVFIRKMGVASFALVSSEAALYFDKGVKVVRRLSMHETIEQLKSKLQV